MTIDHIYVECMQCLFASHPDEMTQCAECGTEICPDCLDDGDGFCASCKAEYEEERGERGA